MKLAKEERHRIIGTDKYALVAEIWIHVDKDYPSDEEDIVRVQDDFDRKIVFITRYSYKSIKLHDCLTKLYLRGR